MSLPVITQAPNPGAGAGRNPSGGPDAAAGDGDRSAAQADSERKGGQAK
jgi:hypothetical protein